MNNQDVTILFLARRISTASNGRGNLKFKDGILKSFDDVIALYQGDELLVSADTFSATSSRHQSAVKRLAPGYTLVPDLTGLVEVMETRDRSVIDGFVLRRKMAISEYERRIEGSKSDNMVVYLKDRIRMEREAAERALRHLPLHEAAAAVSQFRKSQGFFPVG